jgi:Domain of unknown function (DU1801)
VSTPKTQPNDADVDAFLAGVEDERKRADSVAICRIMAEETGEAPRMWGASIVGFGTYHYRYDSGREGDTMIVGFSPRKANLTLYLTDGFGEYEALLERLGKHSTGKSCLYVKRLSDVDEDVLREMVRRAYRQTAARS